MSKTQAQPSRTGMLGHLAGRYMRWQAGLVLIALFCALASGLLSLVGTRLSGQAVDAIAGAGQVNFSILTQALVIMGGCYVLSAALLWLMHVFASRIAFNMGKQMRADAFEKLMHLPLRYYDVHAHGDVISRVINDVDAVTDGLSQGISKVFSGIVVMVGSLGFMFAINPVVALLVLLVTPFSIAAAKGIAKRSAAAFTKQSATVGELNGYIEETLGAQKVVTAFGHEARSQTSFEDINARLYDCGQKAQFYSSLNNPTTRLINHVAYILVGAVGGLISLRYGVLSIGDISSLLIYSSQFARPINDISNVATQFQSALASARRVLSLLDAENERPDAVGSRVVEYCEGVVRFEDVSFSYSKEKRLLQNLNLFAGSGATVAIVGPTGAGKTTLVNLLMRFYETDEGSILLDGENIQQITRDSLRRCFAMVLQESWLFHGSVRENIAYAHPEATDGQVVAAAKAAHAHGFIRRLPDGYDTILEGDIGLSQGQMQLLTIARAMLADAPMMILDEATSSIDTRTEQYIQRALLAMMKGRTCFVIAHRLSTIRSADLILVMRDGDIVEQGTHKELMERQGFYRQLYDSQFAGN